MFLSELSHLILIIIKVLLLYSCYFPGIMSLRDMRKDDVTGSRGKISMQTAKLQSPW